MPNRETLTARACRTLDEGLSNVARHHTHHVALRIDDESVTFDQLHERACHVAKGLTSASLGKGDRIAFVARDSIAGYELLFGCAKSGCVLVPINWRLTGTELSQIIRDSSAKLLFIDADSLEKLNKVDVDLIDCVEVVVMDAFRSWRSQHTNNDPGDHRDLFRPTAETPIVQIYTSGTTGAPKGVVLANRTFFDLLEGMRQQNDHWMELGDQDVLLLSLPLFHIGGMWWAIQGLMAGSCGVLMETFVGWQALKLIERHRITKVAMVPAMIQFTFAEPDIDTVDLSSVTGFLYGGSPIAPELLKRAMDRFACSFFQIYGLTETGNTAVCLRPEDHFHSRLWQAAGRAYYGVELKVTDSNQQPVPAEQIGEIWIKSPSVMLGYWQNTEATADVLQDGWIRTGDAGFLDNQGYLFVCDRIKDMIIYAGENVYPAEIEAALLDHFAVAEAAVIGIPDPHCGERVTAIMVATPGHELPRTPELIQHCRLRLADYKIPKSFKFVQSIPRNPSGKILKHILRKPYWENHSRQVN